MKILRVEFEEYLTIKEEVPSACIVIYFEQLKRRNNP